MIRLKTEKGTIAVDSDVYTNIAGYAATNCFGVKGMAVRSMTDGLVHLLRREAMGKGVKVTFNADNSLSIDLHIMVDKNVNLSAIASSIIGGTMLTGGVGNIIGTLFGVLSLSTIKNIVSSLGLDEAWWTNITVAAMICLFLVVQSLVLSRKNNNEN